MELFAQMEDGTYELVCNCFNNNTTFRVHHWGAVRLVATLNDDTPLYNFMKFSQFTMGDIRQLEAGTVTRLVTGGELRRPRTFLNRFGVNKDARPFTKEK